MLSTIRQLKSGTMDNEKSTNWYGKSIETASDPVIDPGTGKPIIIRQFTFYFNPEALLKIKSKKIPMPTKQELFNSNWQQMKTMLWSDGLVAIEEEDFAPRIVVKKKKYEIFLTCQPRMGTIVNDKIKNLIEVMNPKSLT